MDSENVYFIHSSGSAEIVDVSNRMFMNAITLRQCRFLECVADVLEGQLRTSSPVPPEALFNLLAINTECATLIRMFEEHRSQSIQTETFQNSEMDTDLHEQHNAGVSSHLQQHTGNHDFVKVR